MGWRAGDDQGKDGLLVKEKTYLIKVTADKELDQVLVTLPDVCAEKVVVESWCHSGPVSVSLINVPIVWLLDKILELQKNED